MMLLLWFSRESRESCSSSPICAGLITPSPHGSPPDFEVGVTLSVFMLQPFFFLGQSRRSLIGSGIWPEPAGLCHGSCTPVCGMIAWSDGRAGGARQRSAVANRSAPPESVYPLVLQHLAQVCRRAGDLTPSEFESAQKSPPTGRRLPRSTYFHLWGNRRRVPCPMLTRPTFCRH